MADVPLGAMRYAPIGECRSLSCHVKFDQQHARKETANV